MPKKILIVDDEKLITETLAGMLRHRGYEVLEALDGEAALKFIQEQTPDLVLLDMKLPGIDGLEVLRTLRRDYPGVFIVVMTGYDVEYKKKVQAIGSDGFFVKPILVSDLKEKIEELFSKEKPVPVPSKEILTSLKESPETPQEAVSEENIIPKANILLIEPREMLLGLMQDYFSRREYCEGNYEIRSTSIAEGLRHVDAIRYFQPDIVLFDVALVGIFGEFATTLMNLPNPPKEIILFGDPATKWEDADTLIKRGLLYIPTPLDPQYKLPHKDILDKLAQSLKRACIKHGLYRIKGEKRKDG